MAQDPGSENERNSRERQNQSAITEQTENNENNLPSSQTSVKRLINNQRINNKKYSKSKSKGSHKE